MARAVPLPAASGTITGSVTDGKLMGWSVRETAAAVASFRIREGGSGGKILASVGLVASASSQQWLGPQGVGGDGVLYYEKVAGTIEGAVWIA